MIRRDHPTTAAAISEARAHGYWPISRRDGLLVLFDGKRAVAIAREQRPRSTVFHLVSEFPADQTTAPDPAQAVDP